MSSTPRILLLEPGGPESGALIEAAATRGYEIHAAIMPDQHAAYGPDLRRRWSGTLQTDYSQAGHALRDVVDYASRLGANAVLTTNEYLTPLLAQASAALGLPGNDPARAEAARNKIAMSQAFARHGVSAPHTLVIEDEEQLRRRYTTGQVSFPFVIKPSEAAGSAGVTVVCEAAAATGAWRAARTLSGMYGMPLDPRALVQEYVEGAEYSVESLTQAGTTTHLCVTRKNVTAGAHRVEVGHSLPATLPPAVMRAVHQQVERAIDAVGIRNGASHTEVILGSDGRCAVIEIGARVGAGQIGFLIHHALGVDPWSALLDVALGRPVELTATRRRHAAVRFLTSPTVGRLRSVAGLPEPGTGIPDVRLRVAVGDVVGPAQANRGRLGYFLVTGADRKIVDDRVEQILGGITITIDPEDTGGAAPHHQRSRRLAGRKAR
ncbi:ATP-grasp domain-containing protein [Micromonospora sp. NPDC005686]|uniref:ATP-grasp domain-containing protein n=1 Tax=Micromonospora sp. NPDC005686 TaxID=3364233 RepID=UPI0036AA8350